MINNLINGEDLHTTLKLAINSFHSNGPIDLSILEKLAYIKKYHPEVFAEYQSRILSVMGLFYKQEEPKSLIELAYNNMGKTIEASYGRLLTPVQAKAYKSIHDKKYYSFSAPTSTGKSYLFRELVKEYESDIVIVVPSRALIAEFYSEVIDIVGNEVLVLQFVENVNQHNTARRIFIITPERGVEIFKYIEDFDIGLFLFDEAQISEEDIRGISFDAFVRRTNSVFPEAKKVFAHPFVSNPEAQILKHGYDENSDYQNFDQSSVGKIFVSRNGDGEYSYFSPYEEEDEKVPVGSDIISTILQNNGTVLIYTSKNKILQGNHVENFGKYIEQCPRVEDPEALSIILLLKKYIGSSEEQFGKSSLFIRLMENGVVVHHGSMPLKARLLIEHFVRGNHAKMCIATSTLSQGINMPFDCVWIDYFSYMDELTLKNLIGRSGRTTKENNFDFGYTVVNNQNVPTFTDRISRPVVLEETSKLEAENDDIPDDFRDLVEAIKNNEFNDDLHLPNSQVERIIESNLNKDIEFILSKLIVNGRTVTAAEYYQLTDYGRNKIKAKLKSIYISHLDRQQLTIPEQSVLSASIPLLLWKIQGKSFSETLSLRHAYLTLKDERSALRRDLASGMISQAQFDEQFGRLTIKYSPRAESLPNSKLNGVSLFDRGELVKNFDYDRLIYDTYDYLDKVISLSIADPICAALTLYYEETKDERAKVFKNYLRYGTDNETEIWLIKYGFDAEDVEWITKYIASIDEFGIVFNEKLGDLKNDQYELLRRYIYD